MDDNTDLINTIYKEIDDLVLFETDAKELDEDKYSFEVKEVIVLKAFRDEGSLQNVYLVSIHL